MKLLNSIVLVAIIILTGCISGGKTHFKINIPDIDSSGYNDQFFVEGWKFLKKGDVNKAYQSFRDSSSKDDKLYAGFGYVYLIKHKLKLAERNFKKAVELNPDNLNAEIGLATIEEVRGDVFRAFSLYSKLVIKYPENSWIKIRYEFIKSTQTEKYLNEADKDFSRNNSEGYIKNLQRAAYFSPEVTDIKLKIADHFKETEDYSQASYYYESALENRPNDIEILNKLASVYEKNGKLDSAILIYKKIADLKPGDISVSDKINNLKIKFHELDMPVKFKDIFFKDSVTREELAALLGHYFRDYIKSEGKPVIITDIGVSFVKNTIIKLCSSGIMSVRPDHTFRKNIKITRNLFVITLNSLLNYLQNHGYTINFTPSDNKIIPEDITPLHKYYKIIVFLMNSKIIKPDRDNRFNGLREVTPSEVLYSFRKIIKELEKTPQ